MQNEICRNTDRKTAYLISVNKLGLSVKLVFNGHLLNAIIHLQEECFVAG